MIAQEAGAKVRQDELVSQQAGHIEQCHHQCRGPQQEELDDCSLEKVQEDSQHGDPAVDDGEDLDAQEGAAPRQVHPRVDREVLVFSQGLQELGWKADLESADEGHDVEHGPPL
jgi:hypothetical protein